MQRAANLQTPSLPPDATSRDFLLACAAKQFREQGYAGATLRSIAASAGVTAASLYYHFRSKEEMVVEVLNTGVRRVHEEVAAALDRLEPEAGGREIVEAAVAAHLRSLLELHDFTSANTRIFGQVEDHVREATLAVRRAYEDFWAALLARAAAKGAIGSQTDLGLLRLLLFGAMNGALEWYRPDRGRNIEDIAAEWTVMLLDGVRPRRAE